ncbi:serpin family protein [bacterium]|nr:serpin family protein [bacterium]
MKNPNGSPGTARPTSHVRSQEGRANRLGEPKRHVLIGILQASLLTNLVVVALACPWAHGASNDPIARVVQGNDAVAFRLYEQMAKTDGNLIFSPFGISMALAMTATGAEGNTLEEMRQALAIRQADADYHAAFASLSEQIGQGARKSGVALRIRNALWLDHALRVQPAYRSIVEQTYRASLFTVDFANGAAVSQQINAWASEATFGRLSRMVNANQFSRDTRLLLLNTVFFKGTWLHRFSRSDTRPVPFHVTPTRSVPVPMMHQTMMAGYVAETAVSALELPYTQGGFSMVLLLPAHKDGLGELEASLTVEQVEALLQRLARIEVDVRIPRFAFHSDLPLNTILGTMGMKDAFIGGAADFSRISPDRGLHVSAVRHSAGIEVDEAGTTAWAGTTVQMTEGSPPSPPVFLADHPFLFFILEKSSGTILFMGRVANP